MPQEGTKSNKTMEAPHYYPAGRDGGRCLEEEENRESCRPPEDTEAQGGGAYAGLCRDKAAGLGPELGLPGIPAEPQAADSADPTKVGELRSPGSPGKAVALPWAPAAPPRGPAVWARPGCAGCGGCTSPSLYSSQPKLVPVNYFK